MGVGRVTVEKPRALYLDYSVGGEVRLRCYLAPTSEGFVFGVADSRVADVHLTIFARDGKIRTHIKDASRNPAYVYDRTFTPDILNRKAEARVRKWTVPYHGNSTAWVMRPALRKKLERSFTFPVAGDVATIPWEAVRAQILLDFENPRRWRRVRIRELSKTPNEIGFRIEAGRVYVIRPLDGRRMLKFTEGQMKALDRLVFEYLGFVEYGDYLEQRLSKPER